MILVNPTMQTNSKTFFTGVISMTMATSLLSPALLFAQEVTPIPTATPVKGFCASVETITARIDQRVTDRETKLATKHKVTQHPARAGFWFLSIGGCFLGALPL